MQTSLLTTIAVLVTGIVIGMLVQNGMSQSDESTPANESGRQLSGANNGDQELSEDSAKTRLDIARLKRLLSDEIAARIELQQQFEALRQQVSTLDSAASSDGTSMLDAGATGAQASHQAGSAQNWFNQQALLDAGIDPARVTELKNQYEQIELERLVIRDQSIREKWNRQQYREVLQTITEKEQELRVSLSESEYDAYRYAVGQPNRIAVAGVLDGSQARSAGIQAGDHIIRYNNQRIYDWRDLRDATNRGDSNESVAIDIIRQGESLQFYVTRGPLGIRMNPVSIAP